MQNLLRRLLEIEAFQVGEFRLKSGVLSPIYIDLRSIISEPDLVQGIAEAIFSKQRDQAIKFDVVCGVPYTAVPIASIYSVLHKVPMVMKRKEAKDYGTKKMVEGIKQKGVSCLIIEDIVSSGSSVIETAEVLRKEGLVVTHCVVVLNRMQGAEENLAKAGIKLHSLFTIHDIFDKFCSLNEVEESLVQSVKEYLKDNSYIPIKKPQFLSRASFTERANACSQPVAKRLLEIIVKKESNLCVAVDSVSSKQLLCLADQLGPYVCMIKTHIDILTDFSDDVVIELSTLAKKHDFLIFEDRKFADIGNTVKLQYEQGIYKIQQWADIVTVHGIPGNGILDALEAASSINPRACVLIADMSSKGALTDEHYQKMIVEMAERHLDFAIGFVTQKKLSQRQSFIHFCPGVNIKASGDSLGQQYKSPEAAINNGADVIIVGRGICGAADVVAAAQEYQMKAYNAYKKMIDCS